MDTHNAIHALSRSVDITLYAACGIVIRIAIHWSRYVSRYLGRDTIRVSPAQVSRCIVTTLLPGVILSPGLYPNEVQSQQGNS